MAVDSATTIAGFDLAKPAGGDPLAESDNNHRHIKTVLQACLPAIAGAVTASHTELSYVTGVTSAIQTQLDTKGAKAGQVWTGAQDFTGATITVATQALSDSSTKPASTAFVAGVAFSTSLPAISTSVQDKAITNNGAIARWDDLSLTAQTFFFFSL